MAQSRKRIGKSTLEACKILGLSHEEIALMQYEVGITYIQHVFKMNRWHRAACEQNEWFWNWWCNVWNKYDSSFVARYRTHSEAYHPWLDDYKNIHDPVKLAANIFPHSRLYGELDKVGRQIKAKAQYA